MKTTLIIPNHVSNLLPAITRCSARCFRISQLFPAFVVTLTTFFLLSPAANSKLAYHFQKTTVCAIFSQTWGLSVVHVVTLRITLQIYIVHSVPTWVCKACTAVLRFLHQQPCMQPQWHNYVECEDRMCAWGAPLKTWVGSSTTGRTYGYYVHVL